MQPHFFNYITCTCTTAPHDKSMPCRNYVKNVDGGPFLLKCLTAKNVYNFGT